MFVSVDYSNSERRVFESSSFGRMHGCAAFYAASSQYSELKYVPRIKGLRYCVCVAVTRHPHVLTAREAIFSLQAAEKGMNKGVIALEWNVSVRSQFGFVFGWAVVIACDLVAVSVSSRLINQASLT